MAVDMSHYGNNNPETHEKRQAYLAARELANTPEARAQRLADKKDKYVAETRRSRLLGHILALPLYAALLCLLLKIFSFIPFLKSLYALVTEPIRALGPWIDTYAPAKYIMAGAILALAVAAIIGLSKVFASECGNCHAVGSMSVIASNTQYHDKKRIEKTSYTTEGGGTSYVRDRQTGKIVSTIEHEGTRVYHSNYGTKYIGAKAQTLECSLCGWRKNTRTSVEKVVMDD
jgi:hypothetical protein